MHLESPKREAFELVSDALQHLDEYRAQRDVRVLVSVKQTLDSALEKDPDYFRAHYYSAIVDDLAGRSKEAVKTFTKLLNERPPFIDEVRYNLAVAEYHGYGHEALDRAIQHFSKVMNDAKDPALQLLARAGFAQANAMHMIPKNPDEPELTKIQEYFEKALSESKKVMRDLPRQRGTWFRKPTIPEPTADEIEWTAHNARGMALMYSSDHFPKKSEPDWAEGRIKTLHDAIAELDLADKLSPQNWANYCDMASARMRLGYYDKKHSKSWDDAISILETVVTRLRPGYPFAMYEMGRILRLQGQFAKAIELFDKVLAIPLEQRDISDRRPTIERKRAVDQDRNVFP